METITKDEVLAAAVLTLADMMVLLMKNRRDDLVGTTDNRKNIVSHSFEHWLQFVERKIHG